MKIDGRKRKRVKPPFCNGEHSFGDFILSSDNKLIKKCDKCPAIQTKKEFLEIKEKKLIALKSVKISHIELFQF